MDHLRGRADPGGGPLVGELPPVLSRGNNQERLRDERAFLRERFCTWTTPDEISESNFLSFTCAVSEPGWISAVRLELATPPGPRTVH